MNAMLVSHTLTEAKQISLRWRRRAAHRLLAAVARVGNWAVDLSGAIANVDVIRNVAYGPHPVAHRLDIYRPRRAAAPLPVLLYIHGGAFLVCSKETHRFLALLNAERTGYLVFCINYRLAPNHCFPAAIEDACEAYRWVVQHAARYGGDPQRIVVAGESAGGNLALGVCIAATYPRGEPYAQKVYDLGVVPIGVMPLMPYLQISNPDGRAQDPAVGYFTLAVARDIAAAYLQDCEAGERTLMADPVRVLETCGAPARTFPPVFTGVGTYDMCWTDVKRLEAACYAQRIPVQALYYEGELHAFHVLHWRRAAQAFWQEIVEFMQRRAVSPSPAIADSISSRALAGVVGALRAASRRMNDLSVALRRAAQRLLSRTSGLLGGVASAR